MKTKNDRIEMLKMLISSNELGSQEEVLNALAREGFKVTQATLSRDLKQLKVAKAASMNGKYVYVLPNETMYRRVSSPRLASEMMRMPGFLSINFSGNIGVITGYCAKYIFNMSIIYIISNGAGVSQQQLVSKLSCVIQGLTL